MKVYNIELNHENQVLIGVLDFLIKQDKISFIEALDLIKTFNSLNLNEILKEAKYGEAFHTYVKTKEEND